MSSDQLIRDAILGAVHAAVSPLSVSVHDGDMPPVATGRRPVPYVVAQFGTPLRLGVRPIGGWAAVAPQRWTLGIQIVTGTVADARAVAGAIATALDDTRFSVDAIATTILRRVDATAPIVDRETQPVVWTSVLSWIFDTY